jgi:mono/diheme cytochrome c family protein
MRRVRPSAKERRIPIRPAWRYALALLLGFSTLPSRAQEPAPAPAVDFARDIRPVFENFCLRCHGPEKAKGGLRLDYREALLKGGESGPAIVPGNSQDSLLIKFVSHTVADKEMPPVGKGDPLKPQQLAQLRAWIDQGAVWPASTNQSELHFTLTPTFGWFHVDGNTAMFRALNWRSEKWSGGLEEFSLSQSLDRDTKLSITGRIQADYDYRVALELKRNDVGFIRSGFEQFRSYYDDTGGYYAPFTPSSFTASRDLHVDHGKAWIDFGLRKPDWPELTIGYEYRYARGIESTLQWGAVTVGPTTRNIYPAYKQIDEETHVIKLDASYTLNGYLLEDSFRGEFYRSDTDRPNADFASFNFGTRHTESYQHFVGANSFRVEKQVRDWLLLSSGYLYSHLDGDGSFRQVTFAPSTGAIFSQGDTSPLIVIQSESHVFNANAVLGAWEGLSFISAVQADWTQTDGLGSGTVFGFPAPFANNYGSNQDKRTVEERFELRYEKIPYTTLYAELDFRQEDIGQFEQQFINDGFGSDKDYLRQMDSLGDVKQFKGGFRTSPWSQVTFSASYGHRIKTDDYQHNLDTDLSANSGNGYPGYLLNRDETSDTVDFRIAARLNRWLRSSVSYQYTTTDYRNITAAATTFPAGSAPGGGLLAGVYEAHTISLNNTFTPWHRLYLNNTLSVSDTRQRSGVSAGGAIEPFGGTTWSILQSGTFVVDNKTDLTVTYSFSQGDFSQANQALGLPLGSDYHLHGLQAGVTRRVKQNTKLGLEYIFQRYTDAASGGIYNYTAHGIFSTLSFRW